MSVPTTELPVPPVVRRLAGGRLITAVWRNGIGGTTWRLSGAQETYLKVGRPHPEFDVGSEVARLSWVARYVPAPRVLSCGMSDGLAWLQTEALPGWGAVSGHFGPKGPYAGRQAEVSSALGRALRTFHDSVPVSECPYAWSVAERLAGCSPAEAAQFQPHPPLDLVVCHGDACNPNFLLDDTLDCTGYVDLGRVGVSDRWADLAPALLSLSWNFGNDLIPAFLEGYDIELDAEKLRYYQDLWNAG